MVIRKKIQSLYMQPVVMSTTYGEREGMTSLENAWEMLGGLPCNGFCGYVEDMVAFEMNKDYSLIIEKKKAENLLSYDFPRSRKDFLPVIRL